jgi:hypothetical protein
MTSHCLACGQPGTDVCGRYCCVACATVQIQTIGLLLRSTSRLDLDVSEWHALSASYAADLDALDRLAAV